MSTRKPRTPLALTLALSVVAVGALGGGTAAVAAPGQPGTPRYIEGADGIGDPYFPLTGNGGIDVVHYDLALDYTPPAPGAPLEGDLAGVATIDLIATQDLNRMNLDLRGLTASKVVVNGKSMRFDQVENELRITPRPKLKAGQSAEVVVTYGGTTTRPTDVEGTLYGWVTTDDGAMVVNEPDGAATWFPVNDHPTDKATYRYEITVPEGLVAVANGLPEEPQTAGGRTTWIWDAPDPMASYLTTATIGEFELNDYVAPNGIPVIDAVAPSLDPAASASLAKTGEMLVFFEERYGDYPFNSYGAIVDDDTVGYALETQTRSFFSQNAAEGTVAHELAHQWMGNHVSPNRWSDIWLNESWATYSSWLWNDNQGIQSTDDAFAEIYAIPAEVENCWQIVVRDPGPLGLFSCAVYERGASTLYALHERIGDEDFFALAKAWVERFGGGDATTDDFIALAEEISGDDLEEFFEIWIEIPVKPTSW